MAQASSHTNNRRRPQWPIVWPNNRETRSYGLGGTVLIGSTRNSIIDCHKFYHHFYQLVSVERLSAKIAKLTLWSPTIALCHVVVRCRAIKCQMIWGGQGRSNVALLLTLFFRWSLGGWRGGGKIRQLSNCGLKGVGNRSKSGAIRYRRGRIWYFDHICLSNCVNCTPLFHPQGKVSFRTADYPRTRCARESSDGRKGKK